MSAWLRWILGDLAYNVRWHLRAWHLYLGRNVSYCGDQGPCTDCEGHL